MKSKPTSLSLGKIALIHDWFEEYSGAEKVTRKILDIVPHAQLYALINYMDDETKKYFPTETIKTSFIQKLPFSKRHFRSYLGLFPLAIEQLDLSSYDLIIASSHNVSKGVLVRHDQTLVCYCHSPIRYAWDLYHFYTKVGIKQIIKRSIAKILLHYIRSWDFMAAQRVDYFIANSEYIKARIRKNYNKDSTVIYPPVEVNKFQIADEVGDYYVTVSRLVPYKNIDVIVKAFADNGKRLIVIGQGGELKNLKRIAKEAPNVEFKGFIDSEELQQTVAKSKAFIFASEEDFGIAPVEAQAAGVPVIAWGKGGVLETVVHGKTGIFYEYPEPEDLNQAVDYFERNESLFDRKKIKAHASKFSVERFKEEMTEYLSQVRLKSRYEKQKQKFTVNA